MRISRMLAVGAAFATVFTLSGMAAKAETIELKLAHFLPTINGMHVDFLEPWARELEARTNGKVKVTIYPAGTQLGNIAKLYDSVRAALSTLRTGCGASRAGASPRPALLNFPS